MPQQAPDPGNSAGTRPGERHSKRPGRKSPLRPAGLSLRINADEGESRATGTGPIGLRSSRLADTAAAAADRLMPPAIILYEEYELDHTTGPVGMTAPHMLDPAALETRAAEAERFLRAIASRHRLLILCHLLQQGESSVGGLVRSLSLTQSNLSRHLGLLREEGLVATRREGATIHYRIGSDRVRPMLTELCRMFAGDDPPRDGGL